MPKILVLYHSRTGPATALADAIADGVRSVRFAEVTVRRVDGGTAAAQSAQGAHRTLAGAEELGEHDAIILGAPAGDGTVGAELAAVLQEARERLGAGALLNKVGSAFTPAVGAGDDTPLWALLAPLAKLGMILVPPVMSAVGNAGDDAGQSLDAARGHGKRVAEVVGWVTHAKSHHHHH